MTYDSDVRRLQFVAANVSAMSTCFVLAIAHATFNDAIFCVFFLLLYAAVFTLNACVHCGGCFTWQKQLRAIDKCSTSMNMMHGAYRLAYTASRLVHTYMYITASDKLMECVVICSNQLLPSHITQRVADEVAILWLITIDNNGLWCNTCVRYFNLNWIREKIDDFLFDKMLFYKSNK